MLRRAWRGDGVPAWTLGMLAVLAAAGRPARAQSAPGRAAYPYSSSGSTVGVGAYSYSNVGASGTAGTGSSTPGPLTNPFASSAMNPFLNPYAAMYAPASGMNAGLFFLAAQQSNGGIGSGIASGTRSRPSAVLPPGPAPTDRRVSDIPGAGASRYFNRASRGGSVPNGHYNRYGNYYSANGH